MSTHISVIHLTEEFVCNELKNQDGSHDWFHIDRVRNQALFIAREEQIKDLKSLEIIELAALLHDIQDWKYSGSEIAGSSVKNAVREFLSSINYDSASIEIICHIVANIGFKNELLKDEDDNINITETTKPNTSEIDTLLSIVQDADRLDAIGAIGIARCFVFAGARNRPIYDPDCPHFESLTQYQYMHTASSKSSPAINHFYEKLLKLKDLMKTNAGKRRAESRHDFMQDYLQQFYCEYNNTDNTNTNIIPTTAYDIIGLAVAHTFEKPIEIPMTKADTFNMPDMTPKRLVGKIPNIGVSYWTVENSESKSVENTDISNTTHSNDIDQDYTVRKAKLNELLSQLDDEDDIEAAKCAFEYAQQVRNRTEDKSQWIPFSSVRPQYNGRR